MSSCEECGGPCEELSCMEYTEAGVKYVRKKLKCLTCDRLWEIGKTDVIR